MVNPDLSLPGHPNIFVVGDLAAVTDPATGEPVPGVAQAAMQMGTHAARLISQEIAKAAARRPDPADAPRPAFRYRDKGTLATIGRGKAVGVIGRLHVRGLLAFQVWAFIHVLSLIGFRSRVIVLAEWIFMYLFYSRGARLITRQGAPEAPPA